MPYVPNQADTPTYPRLGSPVSLDLDNILAALAGYGVIEGCVVSAGSGLTYSVSAGTWSNQQRFAVIAAVSNQAMTAAHASLDRVDAVVITNAGAITIRVGTADALPAAPNYTAGDTVLGYIYVPANATSLASANIVDKRLILNPTGIIYTAGAQTAITTAVTNQNVFPGVTIPANYLKAGDHLRVRAWFSLTTSATAGNLTLRTKFGSTVLATTGAVAWTVSQNARTLLLEIDLEVISTTSIEAQGAVDVNTGATTSSRWGLGASAGSTNNSPVTVGTTAQVLTIDATTSAALTGLTPREMTVEMF